MTGTRLPLGSAHGSDPGRAGCSC